MPLVGELPVDSHPAFHVIIALVQKPRTEAAAPPAERQTIDL